MPRARQAHHRILTKSVCCFGCVELSRSILKKPEWFFLVAGTGLQDFTGLKAILVVHGLTFADVEAHVQVLSAMLSGEVDFPEDGPRTQCEAAKFGIMKKVDAGERVGGHINETHGDELAVETILEFPGEAEFAVDKRFGIFAAFNLAQRPLAALMHVGVVEVVKLKMFRSDARFADVELDIE